MTASADKRMERNNGMQGKESTRKGWVVNTGLSERLGGQVALEPTS